MLGFPNRLCQLIKTIYKTFARWQAKFYPTRYCPTILLKYTTKRSASQTEK